MWRNPEDGRGKGDWPIFSRSIKRMPYFMGSARIGGPPPGSTPEAVRFEGQPLLRLALDLSLRGEQRDQVLGKGFQPGRFGFSP